MNVRYNISNNTIKKIIIANKLSKKSREREIQIHDFIVV